MNISMDGRPQNSPPLLLRYCQRGIPHTGRALSISATFKKKIHSLFRHNRSFSSSAKSKKILLSQKAYRFQYNIWLEYNLSP